ncbi:DnaT-like ssDNA-binding domain-containing protein [Pseudomonas resinovorans]|uniref:DnaT-like ssDNA-binding domain-containing protein n=1 Tax=Metapseudomonas resinovorans TaxID=53412 RepID=A0ABT4Y8T9_METRE|nr:DnaT-like ssDNA-binding domain-containing protein [Pseudomonas resinovorans]MDA8485136.1 DnaT-like ssDNA-binding domain-containing protein [Pseudomonas resinovorans]
MAGDWIKMRTDLLTSPKVIRMASALKADRFRIVGGLLSVWSLFDSHSEDGSLSGYSLEALDDLAAWPGFSAAMVDVGWLIDTGDSLQLPRFEAHNGASAKRRAQDKDRKQNDRKMSGSDADKKRTREEKRREEENNNSVDARQRFEMFEDWQPDELSLAPQLKTMGVLQAQVTPEAVAEFVSYWITQHTADTQKSWCRKLVLAIKNAGVRAAAEVARTPRTSRPTTSKHTGLNGQDLIAGLEANPDGTFSL